MANDLFSSLSAFDSSLEKQVKDYSGLLGLTSDSNSPVEVPNRNGYLYVRFRDNQSEVVSAYNEKVSPVHDLPVLVARQGNRWVIKGRDIERYENWGSYAPFLPEHGFQHEFPRDNPGGDIVFVYPDQFMPLNVYPSGTPGSPNVLIGPYSFKKSDNSWVFVNTGTASLLTYIPTDNQARLVLVYLDRNTGNPGILVNSGTSFAANLTGTANLLPYIPAHTALQEPVKLVRLVSGTTYIGWENLYDVRQFYGRDITGSGGGSLPTLSANRVVVTNNSATITNDDRFVYDFNNNLLILGKADISPFTPTPATFFLIGSGTSSNIFLLSYGSSVAPFNTFARARGDWDNPTALQHGDVIGRVARWRGHDGTTFPATRAEIRAQTLGTWSTGSHGTEIVGSITPSGTVTMQDFLKVNQVGMDILYGFYRISGSPLNYQAISAGDDDTNVTGAELEELTNGSETSLHNHSGWALIEDINLTGGSQASFDFQSIPATYKALKLLVDARSDRAATTDKVNLKINNDTGNNYVTLVQWAGGSEEQNTAGGVYHVSYITAASSPSGWFSNFEMTIPDYTNSNKYKTWQSRGMQALTTGAGQFYIYDAMGIYLSNTAINRITLTPNIGTNFVQYSRAILFGLK